MKIQHKRSNQLDGGLAKQPTSEFMEYGELAVNFNETDPAIFLKDSNDNIVRIAGAGAEGVNDIIVSATAPSTTGLVEGQLWWNSDSTSGKLFVLYNDPSGGGGTDAGGLKWVETSPTPEIPTIFPDLDNGNNQPGTLDDRYLSTEADAGNQTVASTGTTTFSGLVEAGKGVKVTGDSAPTVGARYLDNPPGTDQALHWLHRYSIKSLILLMTVAIVLRQKCNSKTFRVDWRCKLISTSANSIIFHYSRNIVKGTTTGNVYISADVGTNPGSLDRYLQCIFTLAAAIQSGGGSINGEEVLYQAVCGLGGTTIIK